MRTWHQSPLQALRTSRFWRAMLAGLAACWITVLLDPASGQTPVDLFANQPKVGGGVVRLATWNLHHIQANDGARELLLENTSKGNDAEAAGGALTSSFAQAIDDLDLHLVLVVECQPRRDEPDRLAQIAEQLDALTRRRLGAVEQPVAQDESRGNEVETASAPTGAVSTAFDAVWRSMRTSIEYDDPDDPYGNLQFGLLWRTDRIRVDDGAARVLDELRQPRDGRNQLLNREHRAPWLVPVEVGDLQFDLLAVHFKSGGTTPQAAEVGAVSDYLRRRLAEPAPRHLVMLGDWNLRPDQSVGQGRLRRLQVADGRGPMMRILTVETLRPTLDEWSLLPEEIDRGSPFAPLLPYTHLNGDATQTINNLLDHIAISRSLDEVFDHPVQAVMQDGSIDARPGIEIPRPILAESDFARLTDHLPVILTLRTERLGDRSLPPSPIVRIIGAVPNPIGADLVDEQVVIRNVTRRTLSLAGWKIGDSASGAYWVLDPISFNDPATLAPGERVVIRRQGRPMSLDNQDGDVIRLIDASGETIDLRTYRHAATGERLRFD